MDNHFCVIMAGGVGSRFWPLSTAGCPKQFLDPLGFGKSFIRLTYERFLPVIPRENFLVVTSDIYRDQVMEHLPELDESQILLEPARRNTAPCIAYATWRIRKRNPDAVIAVTPSDHLIAGDQEFRSLLAKGLDFVKDSSRLLTIGIKPTRPETGYGYIQFDDDSFDVFHKVRTFTEKPDLEMAKVFLKSGDFLWNSGIFIWSVKGISEAFREFLPDMARLFDKGIDSFGTGREAEFIGSVYGQCQSISIDYGVMEKSADVYVVSGNFSWSDIGTWGSLKANLHSDSNGNSLSGRISCHDTKDSLVILDKDKAAIIQGVEKMLIVNHQDRLLVCRMDDEQQLRSWVEDLKIKYSDKYV